MTLRFETFRRTDWRRGDHPDPQVTITSRDHLSLNQAAMRLLGHPEAVEFLFDRELRMVGLRAAYPGGPNSYLLSPVGSGGRQWQAAGRAFVRHYRLEGERSTRRPAALVDGVLCVDLSEPGIPVTSNRARR